MSEREPSILVPPNEAADDTADKATVDVSASKPTGGVIDSEHQPEATGELTSDNETTRAEPPRSEARTADREATEASAAVIQDDEPTEVFEGGSAKPVDRADTDAIAQEDEPTEVFEGAPKATPKFDEAPTLVHDDDELPTKVAESPNAKSREAEPRKAESPRPVAPVDDPLQSDEPTSDPDWEDMPTKAAGARAVAPSRTHPPSASSRTDQPSTYYAAGFWRRAAGAAIDLAIVVPVSLLLGWLAGAVSGIHLPNSRHHGIDFWLDLLLAGDHAFVGWLGLAVVIGCLYLVVFQGTIGRTLGMKATKTRIIDPYGDPPTMVRAALRTVGYLVSAATLGLGFIWVGFDSDKRGLHDWIAGTYVIKT